LLIAVQQAYKSQQLGLNCRFIELGRCYEYQGDEAHALNHAHISIRPSAYCVHNHHTERQNDPFHYSYAENNSLLHALLSMVVLSTACC
jgi:hypothetical protein